MVVDEAAITIRLLVEVPDRWQAKMREVMTEFLEVLLAQHLTLSLLGTPGHGGEFYSVRRLFAMLVKLSV